MNFKNIRLKQKILRIDIRPLNKKIYILVEEVDGSQIGDDNNVVGFNLETKSKQ
jgi:hypothetical protein